MPTAGLSRYSEEPNKETRFRHRCNNAALQHIMSNLRERWSEKLYGIEIDGQYLQELRFADDILIVARSLQEAVSMLEDLAAEALQVGLEVHFGKTKILNNKSFQAKGEKVDIDGQFVPILSQSESLDYLGRRLGAENFHDIEIDNRLRKAWGKLASSVQNSAGVITH